MKRAKIFLWCGIFCAFLRPALAADNTRANSPQTGDHTMIRMTTTLGTIDIELFDNEAPLSAKNFSDYVEAGFFDGLIFHRVIPGFVIQGGGFMPGMQQRKTGAPITNEADNGLKNLRGTLSMARTNDPHSATSQFFINLKDNPFLDHRGKNANGWGYAVFGKVVAGMDVVDKIAKVPTGNQAGHEDVPEKDVVVTKAEIVTQ